MSNPIRGTVAQLLAKNIAINGVPLNQNSMSVLTRLGFFKNGGATFSKEGSNRPSVVWEIDPDSSIQLSTTIDN